MVSSGKAYRKSMWESLIARVCEGTVLKLYMMWPSICLITMTVSCQVNPKLQLNHRVVGLEEGEQTQHFLQLPRVLFRFSSNIYAFLRCVSLITLLFLWVNNSAAHSQSFVKSFFLGLSNVLLKTVFLVVHSCAHQESFI